jgi:hypothetical protein
MRSTPLPFLLSALALALIAVGCRPKELEHPRDEKSLLARSAISADADRLIDALVNNRVRELHAWMTPSLQGQLRLEDLTATQQRLRNGYGTPLGILEEHTHQEGDLRWYSGLVVHAHGKPGSPDRRLHQRLVLYQFALKGERLDRLLVREHLDVKALKSPARRYTLVTRPHFVSTGEWTVAHGGKRRATNYHHGSRGQRYAYDIVVQKGGRSRSRSGNQGAHCYGLPFLASAPGTVVRAINDVPDNRPGEKGEGGGNGVVIDHGFGEYSASWHMIPGSVQVKVGDKVELGQVLGKVGNSGHSSGPHIHFQFSSNETADSPRQIGLQAPFVDVYVDGTWYPRKMPVRGERVRRSRLEKGEKKARAGVLIDAAM